MKSIVYQLARNIPQDESVGQEKIEGTSDNDAASNHSSGYVACAQRNKENIEKGTDSQVCVLLFWKFIIL